MQRGGAVIWRTPSCSLQLSQTFDKTNFSDLIQKGTVLFSPCASSPLAKGWISMPMPLLCATIDLAKQDVYVWMKKLCHFSELDPTKQFEQSEQVRV